MKVLVVGCLGMLGSDLMASFQSGFDVIGLDRPDIDISKSESCLAEVKKIEPEVIVNAAAFTKVDDCETNETEAFQVNGHGVGYLAKAADATGALLVHYSTDYIFDGNKKEPYEEDDIPNPQSAYGKSKLLGETVIRRFCSHHLILRTSWLFGAKGPNFIRTIVGAARKGIPLRVVNDQWGSPTYSKDLAAHTVKMIDAGCRGTYHVTNGGSCTWYDLASCAIEWAGVEGVKIEPVGTSDFPRPAPRPTNSVLANRRLESEGLPKMRPWPEAVREYVKGHLEL
jgi:dTDP-4-dehydrorhamnose reductase